MKSSQKNELASACQILARVCERQEVQSEFIEKLVEQFGKALANFGVAIEILDKTVEKLSEAYSSTEDTESPVGPRRRLHS
jgi:hypothetical protein